jgi:hypothetical protein
MYDVHSNHIISNIIALLRTTESLNMICILTIISNIIALLRTTESLNMICILTIISNIIALLRTTENLKTGWKHTPAFLYVVLSNNIDPHDDFVL